MAVMIPRSQPRGSAAGDTFIPRFYRKTLGAALGVAVTGLMLSAGQAKALVVSVNGQDWDVTTFTASDTSTADLSRFGSASMPWWENIALAQQFASAYTTIASELAFLNYTRYSPLFATDIRINSEPNQLNFINVVLIDDMPELPEIPDQSIFTFIPISQATTADGIEWMEFMTSLLPDRPILGPTWIWAQASLIGPTGGSGSSDGGSTSDGSRSPGGAENVPGPLPILGLAAAFGFSRKLRNRIKLHSAEQIPS